ncbi:hypothetical protein [Jannaschia sp. 2305UL9-9]|uniref:hypothetical protein n=1 Tax=Jannaschia sp. 2305UL9-9 TaxID=3121638 RepID=UPI0035292BDA
MFTRLTAAALVALTFATGASAMSLPTFTDIIPPIKMPMPQGADALSTRGQ